MEKHLWSTHLHLEHMTHRWQWGRRWCTQILIILPRQVEKQPVVNIQFTTGIGPQTPHSIDVFFFWNECKSSLETRALHLIRSKQSNVTNYIENTEWLTGVCFQSTTLLQALVFLLNRQPARLTYNYSFGTNSFCAGINIKFRLIHI